MVFLSAIHCSHKDVNVIGKVNIINRNIKIGRNSTLYPDVTFWGDGPIVIGDNVCIGKGCILYSSSGGGIYIKNNSIIAAYVYIIDMDHGMQRNQLIQNNPNTINKIILGEDVWIGASVQILRGSIINNGSVIGAGSIVKGTIPEYVVAIGQPYHVIKKRE